MRILRFLRRRWPLFLGIALALLVYAAWPGRSTFTVSPETTYVTEPLDAEGYVDYPAALNARLKKDITKEQNAVVLIVQAIGPRPEGALLPPDFYRWLDIDPPPDDGDYFVPPDKSFAAQLKPAVRPEAFVLGIQIDRKKAWEENQSMTRRWPWRREEFPAVAEWLAANQKPLAMTNEATKLPQFFHPFVAGSKNEPHDARIAGSLMPFMQKCRALANALVTRAMLRAGQGDIDSAWNDLMTCQRLGRVTMRSPSMIGSLVGIAIVAIATNAQLVLLENANPSIQKAQTWLSDLRALPPLPELADKLDIGERFSCLDALQSIACHLDRFMDNPDGPGGQPPARADFWDRLFSRSYDWDPAFRRANHTYDRFAAAARLDSRKKRSDEYRAIADGLEQSVQATKGKAILDKLLESSADRGERIGNLLIALLGPSINRIQNAFDRVEQQQRNLHIAFALAVYHAEFKKYPDTLDGLAPRFLPVVPNDLFADKPMKYDREGDGYLLYSVGENEIDDEGRNRDDDLDADDLRIQMPMKKPERYVDDGIRRRPRVFVLD